MNILQYSKARVLAVWAMATAPMGLAAWLAAPELAAIWNDGFGLLRALLITLTFGLIWQALLVVALVYREQRSLRWSVLREALWLKVPYSPRAAERSPRAWWMLIPAIIVLMVLQAVPAMAAPTERDFVLFIGSDAGQSFFRGNWPWFALVVTMLVFNTVLGEELLFRGLLLPRMQAAFGKGGWLVNTMLFAAYHVHQPWALLNVLISSSVFAYTTQRYRTAWFGIITHSVQTPVVIVLLLIVVLK